MNKKFICLLVFLGICFVCNAETVEYQIMLLNSAGKEYDLTKSNPMGPNSKGQTIGFDIVAGSGCVGWFHDPRTGRKNLPSCCQPQFINERGDVVGEDFYYHQGFIWHFKKKITRFIPPNGRCYIKAANNCGEVVFDDFFRKGYYHAGIYTADKKVILLGSLGDGRLSNGEAINDFSQVVGSSEIAPYDRYRKHAFIWDKKNGMRDLNLLIPQNSGWSELTEANYINNQGLITGKGIFQNETCEFLLVPNEIFE
jgi:probable HAF family extracellular repeat protein